MSCSLKEVPAFMRAEHVTDTTDGAEELVECPCADLAQMHFFYENSGSNTNGLIN